jgi:hypothetical protein
MKIHKAQEIQKEGKTKPGQIGCELGFSDKRAGVRFRDLMVFREGG